MGKKEQIGRYGENPHQKAFLEKDENHIGPSVFNTPLHGVPMGFNNYRDANSTLEIIIDNADKNFVAVIKHMNSCGAATGKTLKDAFIYAWRGDEISAFGSVIGYSQTVNLVTIKALSGKFVEVIIAPKFSDEAINWIKNSPKKNLRVVPTGPLENVSDFEESLTIRGGTLSQTQNNKLYLCENISDLLNSPQKLTEQNSGLEYNVGTVTKQQFGEQMLGLIDFSIKVGKHVKSNSVDIFYEYENGHYMMLGMGTGQPNRLDSAKKLAATKAQENLMRVYFREHDLDYAMTMDKMIHDSQYRNMLIENVNSFSKEILYSNKIIAFSDAFFPKPDGVEALAEIGVKYIVCPGGSKADEQVIKKADELGMGMIFTGIRHFRH